MTTLSDVSTAKTEINSGAAPLWRPLLGCFALLTVVTGLIYPMATTLIGRALYPAEVEGSLIRVGDRVVGSELIGQRFVAPRYFWGRPSATSPASHDAAASAGANLGPTNPALEAALKERIAALKAADPDNRRPIPVELVTTSASGLDPDISVAAAYYQLERVARARGWPAEKVKATVDGLIQGRQFGVLGEPRVNVLRLNLELDRLDGGAR